MEYRLGTCSSCKSQFRVPATFTADRAKCKKCAGVVELGPVMGSAPHAARPAPAPASRASGAPRQAAPEANPAPEPAPASPVAPPPKPAPAPAPAAASSGSAADRKSVRQAAAEAASRVQAAGAAGPGRRGQRGEPQPKKSKTVIWIGSAALVAGLVAGGWLLLDGDEASEIPAAATEPALDEPSASEHAVGGEAPAEPAANPTEAAGDEDP